jgi:hypothetical protein
MTDIDGAVKELIRILGEKNLLTDEEIRKIRSRYQSARTTISTDPI